MKKVFLSAAAISVAFVAFAFAPAEKNDLLNDAQTLTEVELASETGICDAKYRTERDFSECNRITTPPSEVEIQTNILGKY